MNRNRATGHGARAVPWLLIGPPASGKTSAMVDVARAACAAGKRVWWLALPHQRAYVFGRATQGGSALLGLEVMSAQQAFYRVLSATVPEALKPLVVGTARIVQVAEALASVGKGAATPGEAKLFAAAIAEAKRYEVPPEALGASADPETSRLAAVYQAYQELLGGDWDYDDVRSAAAALVSSEAFAGRMADAAARAQVGLPDIVIVDGWRELSPLDWRFLGGLARSIEVHVTLPEAPPGVPPAAELGPRGDAVTLERYGAVNPVAEARWVLRSLKRDLAAGHDPLSLAVVAPRAGGDALLALADEYGVPLMDERGTSLADTPEGRTLLDLLELADGPTPARLLAVPQLAPVAATALRLGVTGGDALARVAQSAGLIRELEEWTARLSDFEDPVEWTRWLLDTVLPETQPDVQGGFHDSVLAAAQHASRLGGGATFRAWLAALLRDVREPRRLRGGVALLDADLASGRRFERCYVMGATVGAYGAGEREDYFVPDELRRAPPAAGSLPRRFTGADRIVIAELLTRGEATIVTAAAAGTDGKLVPDERLTGPVADLAPLPDVPAGSRLELGGADVYLPTFEALPPDMLVKGRDDERPDAEWLRTYAERCAFRAWGESALTTREFEYEDAGGDRRIERELGDLLEPLLPDEAEWYDLVAELRREPQLTAERLSELRATFPWAAEWLEANSAKLMGLTWGPRLVHSGSDVSVRIDAGARENHGRKAVVYRFVEPAPRDWDGEASDWRWASKKQRDRWSEYLAASAFLSHRGQAAKVVEVVVWPVLGEPISVHRTNKDWTMDRIAAVVEAAAEARQRLATGDVSPQPGFWCADCRLFYVCRMGQRE